MSRWLRALYEILTEGFATADLLEALEFWKASESRPRQGAALNSSSGEHDRVAAADGPAIDNRGVDADVYCVVLSGRAEDS